MHVQFVGAIEREFPSKAYLQWCFLEVGDCIGPGLTCESMYGYLAPPFSLPLLAPGLAE